MATATIDRSPAGARTPRSAFRYVATGARILLGLVFFVFGLNGFLHFIPCTTTGRCIPADRTMRSVITRHLSIV
jgi:hypothetical protein